MTFSECPGVPLGWNYTFTNTSMTLTGSDGWGRGCIPNKEETFTVDNMTTLASDFEIPFKCAAYPVCKSADFNRTVSGTDDDGQDSTWTYRFNRGTNVLTAIKDEGDIQFTEVITIRER